MKRRLLYLLASLCAICSYGQKSTYSGPYRLPALSYGAGGEATYEYIELDDERILDGKFICTYPVSIGVYKMEGLMKNNKPFGSWTFTGEGSSVGSYDVVRFWNGKINGLVKRGVKTIMKGNYNENGKKDGKWTLVQTDGKQGYQGTAYFTNGYLSGSFEASATVADESDRVDKFSLRGQFAEEGLPDSTWVGRWNWNTGGVEYLLKMTFDKGRFVSLKLKDQSTGQDISEEYSDYTFVSGIYANDFAENSKRNEGCQNLPDVFALLLGAFLGDPLFSSENPTSSGLTLDWSR